MPDVQAFIGTPAYLSHKGKRFRGGDDPNIAKNDAFILADPDTRQVYSRAFAESSALYYDNKPDFGQVLEKIAEWIERL